ncbi:MAG: DUF6152 family protein [Synechococcales cyanobacterium]
MPSTLRRRTLLILGAVSSGLWLSQRVSAHHGWGWATDEEFSLTGTINAVTLGNPHGEVSLDVEGTVWIIEIGQPWRNQRAGLTEAILRLGQEVTVYGHRSAKSDERLVKAERLVIAEQNYDLYPERAS